MSLLLDALKKAEEAKRLAASGDSPTGNANSAVPAPARELSLEPVGTTGASSGNTPQGMPGSALPTLSDHLDTVNADLAAVTTAPPLRTPPPEPAKRPAAARPQPNPAAEQEAARNVFAAKRTPPAQRTTLWIALGAAAIGALGIGGWLWWQLNSVGGGSLSARPAQATGIQPLIAPPVAPPAASPAPVAALPPSAATASATTSTAAVSPTTAPAETTASYEPPPARSERRGTAPAEPEGPVRITRGELKVPPPLARAYELLETNDLSGAARAYEQALKADPKSSDALLGMAALALRSGDFAAAESWYIRALEADPRDANAHAGLVNLRGQADPLTAESRLKGLLATQPDSATLNFALGNLYAGQRRWPEAQLAYFNAHTADTGNPDYLFNLAASLDQMHLPKIALDYYKAALVASNSRRAAFNAEQVKARIAELQP
ncbi:MAG: tetratricopeptide repeat protein [Rhodocyclaceae bacterium]|nr:tetratricopeptide repeat protein [Rhodocyclaceae bacterium]